MPDHPNMPEPPSDDEIEASLRRAVERAFAQPSEQEDEDLEARFPSFRSGGDDTEDPEAASRRRLVFPEEDPEFSERLEALHARADQVKTARETKTATEKRTQTQSQEESRSLGMGLSIAYTLIGLPVVLALVGWLIDRQLGTNAWKAGMAFAGMVIGLVHAVMMLNKSNREG